jgi:hypothetical protein
MRLVRRHRGSVEYQSQPSVWVKDGSAGTTKPDVTRPKVLVTMDENWPLFSNARTDAIRAFDFFRPDSSYPNAPILELFRLRFSSPVVNCYSVGVAQQNDVALLADDRIKTIDFFLGMQYCLA